VHTQCKFVQVSVVDITETSYTTTEHLISKDIQHMMRDHPSHDTQMHDRRNHHHHSAYNNYNNSRDQDKQNEALLRELQLYTAVAVSALLPPPFGTVFLIISAKVTLVEDSLVI